MHRPFDGEPSPATALGFNPPELDVMEKPPRRKDDALISTWSYVRYFVVGMYVGCAVVGIFVYWYTLDIDGGHPLVTFAQLTDWHNCRHKWGDKGPPFSTFNATDFGS